MGVILNAIQFNHNPLSATNDAFNIRRDATRAVAFPEWQRGLTNRASDSLAAYAIEQTRGSTITIQAEFFCDEPVVFAEVRAVQPPAPAPPQGLLEALALPLAGTPAQAVAIEAWRAAWAATAQSNVLGEVAPARALFINGRSAFTTFTLRNARIWSAGVGVHEVHWQWQFRFRAGDPWTDIIETRHTIYTVLSLPTSPWEQIVSPVTASQLPWTDVLDVACRWAAGAQNRDVAAASVTLATFNLGEGVLQYDCVNLDGFGQDFLGSPHYTWFDPFSIFECTLFLDRLRGGIGAGPFVNCSDCATIVSTFANILGCSLWQSRMGYFFRLNPILAIGSDVWQTACGNFGSFLMHEVAWTDACTSLDAVFDACLAVDVSGHPGIPPETAVLPMNMPFGFVGQTAYRAFLSAAVPNGQPLCNPRPETRKRRAVI